jgi:CHAT domain-containing protein
VLFNLLNRAPGAIDAEMAVLTVGDPTYPGVASHVPESSRFGAAGVSLNALPFSGVESNWVKAVFDPAGLVTGRLIKTSATEAGLRAAVEGRMVVHLACHGLTDNEYGNFFGALALTPGPRAKSDALDDGFLTLPEIYGLNLRSCELAILSACETNYGPQQQGEGTWALSRGFLVAGSRRVVASNWLVDDEAAASLMSYFCGGLASAKKQDQPCDYARSLHDAKRWVRQQEKWSNPYYWGTFVLVGPN